MVVRLKTIYSPSSGPVSRMLVATLLAIGIAMYMVLSAGMAEACPQSKDTNNAISAVHKQNVAHAPKLMNKHKRSDVVMSAASSTQAVVKDIFHRSRCCGSGCHSQGIGCASGCCFASPGAIDAANFGIFLFGVSASYYLPRQDRLFATKPLPDFRPPRIVS